MNNVDQDSQGHLYVLSPRGYSAYEVAVQNGFEGTEEEWLASLVGETGPAGDDGYSPSASVTKEGSTATITITDKDGTTTTTVSDGENGQPGAGVPTGGTTGQILAKKTDTDYDTEWINVPTPDLSNYLAKNNTTSYTPSGDYNPSTKKYVDDSIASAITDALGGNY